MTTAANLHWNIFGWLRVLTSENFQHVEGCEPNIWDELTIMQKGLSKTWSVGLCFFSYIFWQIFDEDIFHWIFGQFLTSTSGAISFSFQMLSEWLVGWAESELLWDEGHHRTTHWGINTTSILTSCRYFYFSIFIRSLRIRGLIHHWSVSHGLLRYFPLLSNHFFEGKYCFFVACIILSVSEQFTYCCEYGRGKVERAGELPWFSS